MILGAMWCLKIRRKKIFEAVIDAAAKSWPFMVGTDPMRPVAVIWWQAHELTTEMADRNGRQKKFLIGA